MRAYDPKPTPAISPSALGLHYCPAHARILRLRQEAVRNFRALLTERDRIFDAAVTISVTLSSL
jgi:hypothetical protein